MENIKKIITGIYDNPSLRKTIVPLFIGNPGVSKSSQVNAFAKERGVKVLKFVTSQRNPYEISGISMPNREEKKMSIWDFDAMLSLKDGDILFFDEVLNGNPTVLNACLTLLEEREMISGRKLPNIMIIAAANPQGMVPLTPQIKERFVWYDVEFSRPMWERYIKEKYKTPDQTNRTLSLLVSKEEFKGRNYNSGRSIDKAIDMIICGVPTPYAEVVKPILDKIIKNPLEKDVDLGNGETLLATESISWLKLMQIKLGKYEVSKE